MDGDNSRYRRQLISTPLVDMLMIRHHTLPPGGNTVTLVRLRVPFSNTQWLLYDRKAIGLDITKSLAHSVPSNLHQEGIIALPCTYKLGSFLRELPGLPVSVWSDAGKGKEKHGNAPKYPQTRSY